MPHFYRNQPARQSAIGGSPKVTKNPAMAGFHLIIDGRFPETSSFKARDSGVRSVVTGWGDGLLLLLWAVQTRERFAPRRGRKFRVMHRNMVLSSGWHELHSVLLSFTLQHS